MRSIAVSLALLLFSTASVRAADDRASKVVWNNPVAFTEPGLTHHHFASKAMQREIGYSVWLPTGYDASDSHYPVIYFLHGSGGTESADAPAFSHMLAERVATGKIPPVIAVFPNGGLSGYRDHPEGNLNVESMIVQELVPLIDHTYRTRTDRNNRALGGFSMGGGGSVRLALRHPDLFSAAASWAGAFFRRGADEQLTPEFETDALAKSAADPVRLLFIVGYDDLTYPSHLPAIAALEKAHYPFSYRTIAGLGHELGRYYSLTGDELISFLADGFTRTP